jgi:transcriptional regulator with XRE-family HTH domain
LLTAKAVPQVLRRRHHKARLIVCMRPAGLSQYELAEMLEVPQSNVAFWEQSEKPPRSDLLPKMADVLGVEIVDLLNTNSGRVMVQRSSRPPGKLRKVFEDVSRLPRRQQEHIVRVVSALVMQYEQSRQ